MIWLLGLYRKKKVNLTSSLKGNIVLESMVEGVNLYFTKKHKYTLLYYLFELAESDKEVNNKELAFIFRLGKSIGLSEKELNSITAVYFSSYIPYPDAEFIDHKKRTKTKRSSQQRSNHNHKKQRTKQQQFRSQSKLDNSLAIFNLKKSASNQEIKQAYRKAVKKHHPDRVAHLGEDHVVKATAFFKRITLAYEYLQKVKGIK